MDVACAGCGCWASRRLSSPAGRPRRERAVRHGAARERGRRRSAYQAPNGSVAPGPVSSGAESKRRRCPRSRAVTLLAGRGVAPRGGLQHAPRAHAAGTDEKPLPAAAHRDVHLLEVRPPEPLRLVVGVAHVVADGALFAADLARARHEVARVARRPGACNVRACGEAAEAPAALPVGRRRAARALPAAARTAAAQGAAPPPPPRPRRAPVRPPAGAEDRAGGPVG